MNDILYRDLSGELSQLILRGAVNNSASDGMFCFNVNSVPSNSNWNVEAHLTYQNYCFNATYFSLVKKRQRHGE